MNLPKKNILKGIVKKVKTVLKIQSKSRKALNMK